ncbi:MAG TPA: DEAD/DEAH box helicase [Herpetosiphonaceae bacterium]
MHLSEFLQLLQSRPEYRERIVHLERINPRMAEWAESTAPLAAPLQAALDTQGIRRLYSHQAQALDLGRARRHFGVVTATASGKTLCYHLPTLEAIHAEPRARALYLFPTKALAQDQLRALRELTGTHLPHIRAAIYDGDTPQSERATIRASANILLSNPDMLHMGILPNHATWSRFFSRLTVVVIDEAHVYRGVFGSHVALLLRRLRRVCRMYGSDPQFIFASATIGNPHEHLRALLGDDVAVIDGNGAPQGARTVVFWNPPLQDVASGQRASTNVETTALFTELVEREIKTITFTRARKIAELLVRYARSRLEPQHPDIAARISSYRAGYQAQDRRAIERALFTGELIGIVSTNAMELGVDIGGLDAAILNGYPGTVASTWQQFGRAGRGQEPSLGVLVALDDPMDQYWMRHPAEFFARPHEQARIALDNPYILSDHLLCAAYERPLEPDETAAWFGDGGVSLVAALIEDELLRERSGRAYMPIGTYPAEHVSIRATGGETVELRLENGHVLEQVPLNRAPFEVHSGAIYLHQGESYLVLDLDLLTRSATARQAEVSYYTQPRDVTDVQVVEARASRPAGITTASFGEVDVRRTVVGYRRKALYKEDVLSDHELELPPQQFVTHAIWFTLPRPHVERLRQAQHDLRGGLHAAEHAMIALLPLLAMCDRWDIGGVSTAWHPDTDAATIFIYDGVPGGVGISELGYGELETWWRMTRDLIRECPCADGCPGCIQSPKCGNGNQPLDKAVALDILNTLLAEA